MEKGSLTLVVMFLVAGLTFSAALVVDLGLFYYTRTQLARAADAAVLAGVQHLPGDGLAASVVAQEYVERNGCPKELAQVTVASDGMSIRVALEKEIPYSFGRLFGQQAKLVTAQSAAVIGSVKALTGAVPFGVEQHNFEYGKQYILKRGAGQAGSYKGNFGALALGGKGAAVYRDNMMHGYPDVLELGAIVPTEPGNVSGPTSQGVAYRINQDPLATWENYRLDSPRIIKVPVIKYLEQQGRTSAQVVGFAAFFLEGVGGSGHNNYVVGRFLKMMVSNDSGSIDESGSSGTDFGLYSYKLVI